MERTRRVQRNHRATDDGLQRWLHHGDDGLRVVATVGEAIRRPSDRDCFGQREVSTLQTRRGVGEGIGHHVAVPSELLAEPELDRTAVEIREKKVLVQCLLRNLRRLHFRNQQLPQPRRDRLQKRTRNTHATKFPKTQK